MASKRRGQRSGINRSFHPLREPPSETQTRAKRYNPPYVFSYLRGFDFLQPFLWRTYGLPEAPRRVRPVRAMS